MPTNLKLPRPGTRVRAVFEALYEFDSVGLKRSQLKDAYDDHPPAHGVQSRRYSSMSLTPILQKFASKQLDGSYKLKLEWRSLRADAWRHASLAKLAAKEQVLKLAVPVAVPPVSHQFKPGDRVRVVQLPKMPPCSPGFKLQPGLTFIVAKQERCNWSAIDFVYLVGAEWEAWDPQRFVLAKDEGQPGLHALCGTCGRPYGEHYSDVSSDCPAVTGLREPVKSRRRYWTPTAQEVLAMPAPVAPVVPLSIPRKFKAGDLLRVADIPMNVNGPLFDIGDTFPFLAYPDDRRYRGDGFDLLQLDVERNGQLDRGMMHWEKRFELAERKPWEPKVGDWVKCIDQSGCSTMRAGDIYKVKRVSTFNRSDVGVMVAVDAADGTTVGSAFSIRFVPFHWGAPVPPNELPKEPNVIRCTCGGQTWTNTCLTVASLQKTYPTGYHYRGVTHRWAGLACDLTRRLRELLEQAVSNLKSATELLAPSPSAVNNSVWQSLSLAEDALTRLKKPKE